MALLSDLIDNSRNMRFFVKNAFLTAKFTKITNVENMAKRLFYMNNLIEINVFYCVRLNFT